MDLEHLILRQITFSRATFGPDPRPIGVCNHIAKELAEIAEAETRQARFKEWMDVIILGIDGAWRELIGTALDDEGIAEEIVLALINKQTKNEARHWPDWRTMPADGAIEHVRGHED